MSRKNDYELASTKDNDVIESVPWYRGNLPWFKTIIGTFHQFVFIGFLYNFGLFFDELQHEFQSSVALTGWIGSISYCSFMFGTLASTWVLRHLSFRKFGIIGAVIGSASLVATSFSPTLIYVILFYGVFYGLSANISMILTNEVVILLFHDKRRASAMTLVALGATFGNFAMSNLIEFSLEHIGWRWTFRISAAVIFIFGMFCCIFFTKPTNVDVCKIGAMETKRTSQSASRPSLLCFPEVWLFSLATFTCYLALVFQYVYMATFLESIGLSNQKSATGITVLAIGDAFSKVVIILVAPRIPFPLIYCLPVSLLVLMIVSVGLTLTTNTILILCITFCYGLPRGVYNGLQLPTGLEIFGARRSKTSANIVLVWSGVGNLIGPFIQGSLYDSTGSYNPALYLCTGLYLVSSVTLLLAPLYQKYFAPDRYMVDYKHNKDTSECKNNHLIGNTYVEEKVTVV